MNFNKPPANLNLRRDKSPSHTLGTGRNVSRSSWATRTWRLWTSAICCTPHRRRRGQGWVRRGAYRDMWMYNDVLHTHIYIHIKHTYIHAWTCACICIIVYAHTHIYIYIHLRTHTHAHTHIYIYIYASRRNMIHMDACSIRLFVFIFI
jgi:hypothetical protein